MTRGRGTVRRGSGERIVAGRGGTAAIASPAPAPFESLGERAAALLPFSLVEPAGLGFGCELRGELFFFAAARVDALFRFVATAFLVGARLVALFLEEVFFLDALFLATFFLAGLLLDADAPFLDALFLDALFLDALFLDERAFVAFLLLPFVAMAPPESVILSESLTRASSVVGLAGVARLAHSRSRA